MYLVTYSIEAFPDLDGGLDRGGMHSLFGEEGTMGRPVTGVVYSMRFLSGGATPVCRVVRARPLTLPGAPFSGASP